jgi:hypothetical protein
MIEADKDKIELLLDRPLTSNDSLMYEDYINQLAYLNELHSSFVQ